MRIISLVELGKRYDIPAEKFCKFEEEKHPRDEKERFATGEKEGDIKDGDAVHLIMPSHGVGVVAPATYVKPSEKFPNHSEVKMADGSILHHPNNQVINDASIRRSVEQSMRELKPNGDRPEPGKQYALIGGTGEPNIAAGNTWAESEVRGVDKATARIISDQIFRMNMKMKSGEKQYLIDTQGYNYARYAVKLK